MAFKYIPFNMGCNVDYSHWVGYIYKYFSLDYTKMKPFDLKDIFSLLQYKYYNDIYNIVIQYNIDKYVIADLIQLGSLQGDQDAFDNWITTKK